MLRAVVCVVPTTDHGAEADGGTRVDDDVDEQFFQSATSGNSCVDVGWTECVVVRRMNLGGTVRYRAWEKWGRISRGE